eukprot:gene31903-38571_t
MPGLAIFLLLLVSPLLAFDLCSSHRSLSRTSLYASSAEPKSQKQVLQSHLKPAAVLSGSVMFGLLTALRPAYGRTVFDTDVYGDKELKIAALNKLKQKIRDALLADPSLAAGMLQLALLDALDYNKQTQEGGADGSVVALLSASASSANDNEKELGRVLGVLQRIQKDLKRTTTVGIADVIAFGGEHFLYQSVIRYTYVATNVNRKYKHCFCEGAEALESVGAGRVTVQIGRFDLATSASPARPSASSFVLSSSTALADLLSVGQLAGMGKAEVLLLLCALYEVERVASSGKSAGGGTGDENDDEQGEDAWQDSVPRTFGAPQQIYGQRVGQADFSAQGVTDLLSQRNSNRPRSLYGSLLLQDAASVRAALSKYSGPNGDASFRKDVVQTYLAVTKIGEAYTTRNS